MAEYKMSLKEVYRLTFRQVACLSERYWHRKGYEFSIQLKLNPFVKQAEKPIDATSDDIDLSAFGITVTEQ